MPPSPHPSASSHRSRCRSTTRRPIRSVDGPGPGLGGPADAAHVVARGGGWGACPQPMPPTSLHLRWRIPRRGFRASRGLKGGLSPPPICAGCRRGGGLLGTEGRGGATRCLGKAGAGGTGGNMRSQGSGCRASEGLHVKGQQHETNNLHPKFPAQLFCLASSLVPTRKRCAER